MNGVAEASILHALTLATSYPAILLRWGWLILVSTVGQCLFIVGSNIINEIIFIVILKLLMKSFEQGFSMGGRAELGSRT
jgi:hypothetical protein